MIFQIQLPCAAVARLALLALTTANPLSENVPTATLASPTAMGAPLFGPSCFPLLRSNTTTINATHALSSYRSDCDRAIDPFVNYPTLSQYNYLWYRMGPDPIPPPGTQSLPYKIEKGSCVVKLDVLNEPKACDRLTLRGLKYIVEALADVCVRPYMSEQGGGIVAVGRKKVPGVTIRPSLGIGLNGQPSVASEK